MGPSAYLPPSAQASRCPTVSVALTTAHAVERIEFDDGVLVTGVGDTAAQVYRLYDAVLDRNPDASGLRN